MDTFIMLAQCAQSGQSARDNEKSSCEHPWRKPHCQADLSFDHCFELWNWSGRISHTGCQASCCRMINPDVVSVGANESASDYAAGQKVETLLFHGLQKVDADFCGCRNVFQRYSTPLAFLPQPRPARLHPSCFDSRWSRGRGRRWYWVGRKHPVECRSLITCSRSKMCAPLGQRLLSCHLHHRNGYGWKLHANRECRLTRRPRV